MKENITFYIRYKTYAPVACHTHYPPPSYYGPRPLSTVSELISSFFPKSNPFELASYRLYAAGDGVETPLEPDMFLSDIHAGRNDDDPLIIRSDQGMTMKSSIVPANIESSVFTHGYESKASIMKENETFYIRYKTYAPVACHTHYPPPSYDGPRPLSTVFDLISSYKYQNSPRFKGVPIDELTLYAVLDGVETPLEPDMSLSDIHTGHNDDDPLIIRSDQAQVSVDKSAWYWRVTGTIKGPRKSAFRRTLHNAASADIGCYEDDNGHYKAPFSYPEQDVMAINVLFKSENKAMRFRVDADHIVSNFSPFKDFSADLRVEAAPEAKKGPVILPSDFVPDEDSLPETPRSTSTVTEVYEDSPLFKYQRIETDSLFRTYKPDKCHFIDKSVCQSDPNFKQYQNDENNFIALSKDAHAWFDGNMNMRPGFMLTIQSVSEKQDPENDFRYAVLLKVETFDVWTSQNLFPRLKEGSIRSDETATTIVYVEDPLKFRFCLEWKATKTRLLWEAATAQQIA